jgi:putative ABC transport system ATP-binding protein
MIDAAIRVHQVGRTYFSGTPAEVKAVKRVDLCIGYGEFVAVMGASGSGKSTLLNILGCLDTPSTGTYQCCGVDVATLNPRARANLRATSIGFVFQQFNLLPRMTAFANVILPLDYTSKDSTRHREKGMAALEAVGMADRASHFPSELSGGQQQRVAIARALVNEPSIVLADEPTGALDSKAAENILQILCAMQKTGRTILVVTHDVNVARHAHRVVMMKDGQLPAPQATE